MPPRSSFYAPLLVLAFLVLSCAAKSLSGSRVIAVVDSDDSQFSTLFNQIRSHDLDLSVTKVSDNPSLFEFDDRSFDHVLLLVPTHALKSNLSPSSLISFMRHGGNLLIAGSGNMTESQKDLVFELGVTVVNPTRNLVDPFHSSTRDTSILAVFPHQGTVVSLSSTPVAFRGVGHLIRTTSFPDIVFPIVHASPTVASKHTDLVLVSGIQARNGARAVVAGSIDMLKNEFLELPLAVSKPLASSTPLSYPKARNLEFVDQLVQWAFHEKSIVRLVSFNHHKVNETQQRANYRIKDEIVINVTLQEWIGDQWVPYLLPPSTHLYFSAEMLDPYIRLSMQLASTTATTSTYSLTTRLPDRYGVFTFAVDFTHQGISHVHREELVPIHPFRHNEYPRWIPVAYPYYVAGIAQLVATFLLIVIWITHKHTYCFPKPAVTPAMSPGASSSDQSGPGSLAASPTASSARKSVKAEAKVRARNVPKSSKK